MASSSTRAPPPLLLLLMLLLIALLRGAAAAPSTEALSVLCNGATYGAGDPFAASLSYVLSELVSETPAGTRLGGGGGGSLRDFYDISPYPTAFAYGHAACRPGAAAAEADCAACLRSAVSQMGATCGRSVGARAVLVDCSVRYEQYPFAD